MTTLDVYKDWLGIGEGPRPPDHYELLRLPRFDDNVDRIRANYKKLNAHVRKYASGQYSLRSQELLNELAKAMLCLTDPERKREYDESLGRVVETEAATVGLRSIGKVLIDRRAITREQLKEAESFAEARGLSFRDALVQMKLVDPATAAQALAEELGRSYIDLADVIPDDSVLDKVPRSTVKRHSILPLFIDNEQVLVACIDEPEHELEDEIRMRFDLPMRPVVATPLAINQGIAKYYAAGMRDESAAESAFKGSSGRSGKTGGKTRKRFAQLTEAEQRERVQFGWIIVSWAVVGSILIDRFLLYGRVFPYRHPPIFFLDWWPFTGFLLTLFVPVLVFWWVYKIYWK
jgi:hypothetical protein